MSSEAAQVSMSHRSSHSTMGVGVEGDELPLTPSSDDELATTGDVEVRLLVEDTSYSILKRERSWS